MKTQPLDSLLYALDRALQASSDRRAAHDKGRRAADAIAQRMPLVHRTGAPDQKNPWTAMFVDGVLEAERVRSVERMLGHERAVYFFAGCGAYPKGTVALLLLQAAVPCEHSTFTPFDTGAMTKGFIVPAGTAPAAGTGWSPEARRDSLGEHLGHGLDLAQFIAPYLAAHFHDPHDYVTRRQKSEPDFPAYHGLISTDGDRRAWTIEVQVHTHVSLSADASVLAGLLLDDKDLRRDLPAAYLRFARVVRNDDDDDLDFTEAIAAEVMHRIRHEDDRTEL